MYSTYISETILKAIKKAIVVKDFPDCEIPPIIVMPPKKKEYGDYTTTVAMVLGTALSMDPYLAAKKILNYLDFPPSFAQNVTCAPKGFINITLSKDTLCKSLVTIIHERDSFGKIDCGKGSRIFLESVNGLYSCFFNVDEGRKLMLGDILRILMEYTNHHVTIEPLMRDCGESNRILGLSVEARYRELMGDDSPFPANGYKNKFVVDLARAILDEDGAAYMPATKGDRINILRERGAQKIGEQVKKSMRSCGVDLGSWIGARHLMDKGGLFNEIKEKLAEKSFTYEKDDRLWVRSTEYGDQKDRMLLKEGKEPSDFALDLCFLVHNLRKKYDRIIYLKSADEALDFFMMLSSTLKILGYSGDSIEVLPVEKVRLTEKAEKMEKVERKPEEVLWGKHMHFEELLASAGRDAVRFFYYLKTIDTPLEFDLSLVHKESNLNPLYYVQFACCRLKSIMKMAETQGIHCTKCDTVNLRVLEEKSDLELARKIIIFPAMIASTVRARDPYLLVFYTAELVNEFQNYYSSVKVFSNDAYLTKARLVLMEALKILLFRVMDLLKIKVPEKF